MKSKLQNPTRDDLALALQLMVNAAEVVGGRHWDATNLAKRMLTKYGRSKKRGIK